MSSSAGSIASRPTMILSRILAIACALLLPAMTQAQSLNIDLGSAGGAGATGRLVQITALVTVLSLAPSLLVMVTAFTRIVIVLSLLRSALSTQSTPPNMVIISTLDASRARREANAEIGGAPWDCYTVVLVPDGADDLVEADQIAAGESDNGPR